MFACVTAWIQFSCLPPCPDSPCENTYLSFYYSGVLDVPPKLVNSALWPAASTSTAAVPPCLYVL